MNRDASVHLQASQAAQTGTAVAVASGTKQVEKRCSPLGSRAVIDLIDFAATVQPTHDCPASRITHFQFRQVRSAGGGATIDESEVAPAVAHHQLSSRTMRRSGAPSANGHGRRPLHRPLHPTQPRPAAAQQPVRRKPAVTAAPAAAT